jgi:hypothetical protein
MELIGYKNFFEKYFGSFGFIYIFKLNNVEL